MRNYTSSVPMDRSIINIKRKLVAAGAKNVVENYEDGFIKELIFTLPVSGQDTAFKLPAKVDKVFNKLASFRKSLKPGAEKAVKEQALRTAWKNMYDWVDVQLTLIELEQATVQEVMLPYMYSINKGKTLYELVEENGLKALPL